MLTISALTFSSAETYKQGIAAGQGLRLGIKSERRNTKKGEVKKRGKKKIMKGNEKRTK